ncbi:CAP domain-containing protein [Pseudoroseicyclus aestuarii]|uniref:Hemolysin type calcium-binding protein n=1 Tax=Pseudoroseicyclus aestuarii TaxID=1795041 RepID=A0A318SNK3_9RHOB|nr:CAP domain-containing protein [Pseudoroseicyclus aestuarii]PYE82185.1 hemolysin type calcium-binding protein [Pseudoroseicyclus aestuarii]
MSTILPTAWEQLTLELINRTRADPGGEAARLLSTDNQGIAQALAYFDVDEALFTQQMEAFDPAAPLAWNPNLARSAETHTDLMIQYDRQSHNLPGEPLLGARIADAGYRYSSAAENIYAYVEDPLQAHGGFVIDWGQGPGGMQDPAGHRLTIMNAKFTEIGIAIAEVPEAGAAIGPYATTQHFGTRADDAPQLLGVVIADADGDAFYDIGEGLGGITVTATGASGTFSTTSWAAGGYQMALPSGRYEVTFTGPGLDGQVVRQVEMSGVNLDLDVLARQAQPVPGAPSGGNDRVMGTEGPDMLSLLAGNDLARGFGGDDRLTGGLGADTLDGGAGNDILIGGPGEGDLRDVIYGGAGNDRIDGGYGNDQLHGGAGADDIAGGFGADTVIGNEGADVLTGGAFGDMLVGGDGFDFLNGGFGSDRLNGGAGPDRFFHLGVADHGSDWIQDYAGAEGDRLVWGGGEAGAARFQVNYADTPNAGAAGTQEAFVIDKATGQVLWALVDSADETIRVQVGTDVFEIA